MHASVRQAFAGVILGALGCATLAAQNLVITNARIITGNGVGESIARGSVVVRDGRIVSVAAGSATLAGARTIDAKGLTLMPGFIDTHRHVMQGDPAQWMKNLAGPRMQEFLDAGFTTILSCGDALDPILELRRRLAAGEIKGPRLLAVGRVPLARASGAGRGGVDPARVDVSRPPDRPTTAATAIPREETLATVRSLAKAGVDAFKMAIIVTPGGPEKETLALIAAEARRLNIPTITHAVSVLDTLAAVEARTTVLAHTPHIGQLTDSEARTIAAAGIPMMSTLGVFVPTFAEDNSRIRERSGDDNLPRFRDLDPFPMSTLSSAGQGPVNARMMWEAGLTYGYGTDTTYLPHDSLAQELKALRLVFSNKDILKIMTRNAATVLGRDKEIGTLEPGKLADIVLLDGNPLTDIHDVLKVRMVVKGGAVVVERK
jgi:imidazolonepropionase-like amidohydrolase